MRYTTFYYQLNWYAKKCGRSLDIIAHNKLYLLYLFAQKTLFARKLYYIEILSFFLNKLLCKKAAII